MSFLAPLGLAGLLFLPVVVAMYLLKLRRDDRVVPSTLLWHRLLADVEANAPWQRLRRSLLLLLQLLLVLLLAALAARPFLERPAGLARDLVLVIDTSASMGATDGTPDRLAAAKSAAIDALHELPADGKVSVIAAGRTARVVVNGTSDLGRVRAAVDGIEGSKATGDLGDALALADALASRSGDAQILVATDGALAVKPTAHLNHPVQVLQVGRQRRNQAIVALAVRPASSGVTRSVFVSVANLDIEAAQRRLEVYGDGILLEARDVPLDAQTRSQVIIDDVPRSVSVVEVRLTGQIPDSLAVDDRAWAIVPPDHLRKILLVADGDPYLETALTYLPNTELYGVTPAKFGPDTHPELFDLVIFEDMVPTVLPHAPVLLIAPSKTSDLGEVAGTLTDPAIGSLPADEPILKYVDLATTHVGKAAKLVLPGWARSVIPGPAGAPLLYAGEQNGHRAAVLAFAPRQSDLPLQVGFPILMANLTGELLGGSAAPPAATAPGDPVSLAVPAGATGLLVTRPDGSTVELPPSGSGGGAVSFSQTDLLGVYTVTALAAPTGSADPSGGTPPSLAATATPTPTPTPTRTVGPSGPSAAPAGSPSPTSSASPPPADPNAPIRFAVDLFDPAESDIAPASGAAIVALGTGPGASGGVAASPAPGTSGVASAVPRASSEPAGSGTTVSGPVASTSQRQPARDELWIPLVLIALAVLLAEWLVYHRDAVLRLWRSAMRGRGRGGATDRDAGSRGGSDRGKSSAGGRTDSAQPR